MGVLFGFGGYFCGMILVTSCLVVCTCDCCRMLRRLACLLYGLACLGLLWRYCVMIYLLPCGGICCGRGSVICGCLAWFWFCYARGIRVVLLRLFGLWFYCMVGLLVLRVECCLWFGSLWFTCALGLVCV